MNVNEDRLARLLGPDTLELLDAHILRVVEQTLDARESDRRWLSTKKAGEYVGGITDSAIRKWVARGDVRYTRLNGRILIDRRDLDARLERERQ